MTRLQGPRVLVRELEYGDECAVHAFAADPVVTRHTDWDVTTRKETRGFITYARAGAETFPRTQYTLAVEDETGSVIGSVELRVLDEERKVGELGYLYTRSAWGKGYATEVGRLALWYAFKHLRLDRVQARCTTENVASAQVLLKLGMRLEGTLPGGVKVRGEARDGYQYALTRPSRE